VHEVGELQRVIKARGKKKVRHNIISCCVVEGQAIAFLSVVYYDASIRMDLDALRYHNMYAQKLPRKKTTVTRTRSEGSRRTSFDNFVVMLDR
jgi:hypothetical protein